MSKYINVNPDHYKTAGRERPGHAIGRPPTMTKTDPAARERWTRKLERRAAGVRGKPR